MLNSIPNLPLVAGGTNASIGAIGSPPPPRISYRLITQAVEVKGTQVLDEQGDVIMQNEACLWCLLLHSFLNLNLGVLQKYDRTVYG